MSLCRIVDSSVDATEYAEALRNAVRRGRGGADGQLQKEVSAIIENVRRTGWKGALAYTKRFDAPHLKAAHFEVKDAEIDEAKIPTQAHDAIRKSIERVTRFHGAQLKAITEGWTKTKAAFAQNAWEWRLPATQVENSGFEGQRLLPIESVGVYVPGGKANYPSSVIMNVVPAKVAGVERFMICSPPREDGTLSPAILVAARELGVTSLVKCGGAQAIALMAFGPQIDGQASRFRCGFSAVDKIVGPGSKWVNEAKRQLWGQVGLDTYAGPSEVCVIADQSANPAFAAADWLSQVEHAEDNVGFLVVSSSEVADRILTEAEKQLANSPREQTMRSALKQYGLVIIVPEGHDQLIYVPDALASEHVSAMISDHERGASLLRNSGCIALGNYTPQSAGDFCAGPSHTLPTGGAARFSSPLNVMDFLKFQSISQFTKEDLKELLPTIEAFGEMEGFPQHARAARLRFEG